MNRALLLLLFLAVSAHPQLSPAVSRTSEFQNDDISLVLRTLARQGRFELSIAGKITGTVTLRADNMTPREVFDLVVATKHLVVNERDGILYVSTKTLAPTTILITVLVVVLAVAAPFRVVPFIVRGSTHFQK